MTVLAVARFYKQPVSEVLDWEPQEFQWAARAAHEANQTKTTRPTAGSWGEGKQGE